MAEVKLDGPDEALGPVEVEGGGCPIIDGGTVVLPTYEAYVEGPVWSLLAG